MKEFDEWNEVKKDLELSSRNWIIKVREIYWVRVGQNIGYEIYGKDSQFVRPVLIFKRFNKDSFLGIPLTSKEKSNPYYCELNPFHKTKKSYAVLSQVRFYSTKRIKSKFSKISQEEFEIVKSKLGEILYAPKKGLPERAGNLEVNYNKNSFKSKESKND
jgi:mRNA-degrading endonuclease toxin of MazEF toxin-antitoxin module